MAEIDLGEAEEEEEEAPEEELEEEEEIPEEEKAAPSSTPESKPSKERDKSKRHELYEKEGNGVKRLKKSCPRCGPGIFMADHGDRLACGKCGYTEFKTSDNSTEEDESSEEAEQAE